jgi:hypothetical protein
VCVCVCVCTYDDIVQQMVMRFWEGPGKESMVQPAAV